MKSLFKYFKGVRKELKKVTWPTRKETMRSTIIVLGLSLAVAMFLGLADLILSQVVGKLLDM